MFPDDDPRTSGLRMIRLGAEATRIALANGVPPDEARDVLLPIGLAPFLPADGEPDTWASAFLRSALVDAVERVIFLHHWQPVGA